MDCTFKTEKGKFNFRVGAIIQNGNKVLMAGNPTDNFYYSVGGRVRMNETLEEAVLREVYEETGIKAEIERMGFVHENFFTDSENVRVHEISIYFYIKSDEKLLNIENGHKTVDGPDGEFLEWIEIDKKHSFRVFPEFFAEELKNKSDKLKNIVTFQK